MVAIVFSLPILLSPFFLNFYWTSLIKALSTPWGIIISIISFILHHCGVIQLKVPNLSRAKAASPTINRSKSKG
jgi:hypothetical protein